MFVPHTPTLSGEKICGGKPTSRVLAWAQEHEIIVLFNGPGLPCTLYQQIFEENKVSGDHDTSGSPLISKSSIILC